MVSSSCRVCRKDETVTPGAQSTDQAPWDLDPSLLANFLPQQVHEGQVASVVTDLTCHPAHGSAGPPQVRNSFPLPLYAACILFHMSTTHF
jgi:hypothetical protein